MLKTHIKISTGGCRFILDEDYLSLSKLSHNLTRRIIYEPDLYEIEERALLEKHIPSNASVLELGGRIGVTSCVINKKLHDPHKHTVIDIDPRWEKYLEMNRKENDCQFNIVCGQVVDTSHVNYIHRLWRKEKTLNIKDYEFDTLVCDIEGAEKQLIRDNRWLIGHVKLFIIELHPPTLALLDEFTGYEISDSQGHCYVIKRR